MGETRTEPDHALPLVSIGIPTYNRAASLPRAIRSALNQDYPNLEVLVSDNASTDTTAQVAQSFLHSEARVTYFRQPVNRGPSANFDAVLTPARGKYFMWLADDDTLDGSYVRECVSVLETSADHSLVCGRTAYYRDGQFLHEGIKVNLPQASPVRRLLNYYRIVGDNGTFYGLFRREYGAQLSLRNALGGDWFLVARLAFLGKVRTLDQVRIHRAFTWNERSFSQWVASQSLPEFHAQHPYLTIALTALRDIAVEGPVYQRLTRGQRLVLALRAFRILCRRHRVRLPEIFSAWRHGCLRS